MNWLQIIQAIVSLLPAILNLIADVETKVGCGNGVAKKALVMSVVSSAPTEVQSAVSSVVDKVVAAQKLIEPQPK